MASFWAHFVGGLGLRLLGYVVWFTVRLAATCLVVRQLVRRENAPSDLDLHSAMCCIHWWRSMFASLPIPDGLGEGSSNACVMVVA